MAGKASVFRLLHMGADCTDEALTISKWSLTYLFFQERKELLFLLPLT